MKYSRRDPEYPLEDELVQAPVHKGETEIKTEFHKEIKVIRVIIPGQVQVEHVPAVHEVHPVGSHALVAELEPGFELFFKK